jgi:putative ABC transport system permease protein
MESVVIAVIAVLIAVLIIELSIPFFNYLTGGSYELQYWPYLAILLGGGVIIGAVSGAYPALYLSGIMPHLILKGKFVQSSRGSALRKSLIVTQFAISMILISASVIIYRQLNFLQHKNLGFNKEEVIIIPVKNEDGMYQFDAFRNELLKVEGVSMVSASSNIPGKQFNQHAVSLYDNPGHWINSSEAMVDYDFFKSLNINVIEGRGFMRENPADHEGYIINETAARQLHPSGSIVGKEIVWNMGADTVRGPVIGVVNDFHFQSLHDAIRPLCFTLSTRHFNYILIDVNTSDFAERIAAIERVYSQFEPIYGFEFSFLEDQLNQQYSAEKRTGEILSIFSVIAVGIACFGLFGMAMLLFYQKIKEIGVRKVLGATPLSLLMFVLKDFTKLILVSIAIAIPITWYIMKGWLNNFSYQIEIQPLVFLLSGFVLVVLAWVTLSYFTVKAAHINPAEVLKNE